MTAIRPFQSQVHKPISLRLILALAAIVYCIPANRLAVLPGAPLGILGGAILIALVALAITVERRVNRGPFWVAALAVLALMRWSSGSLSPELGWSAAYVASDDPARPIERSTEYLQLNRTRIDPVLDFDAARFPVHFVNDIRRFNFYRPTDIARDTMPFSVTWSGVLVDRPARATSIQLVTNGPADVQIDGQAPLRFETSDVGRIYPLPFES